MTPHSPGPVQNEEWIARIILAMHAEDADEKGIRKPKPNAFEGMDSVGLSVARHCDPHRRPEELAKLIKFLVDKAKAANNPEFEWIGCCIAKVENVRNLIDAPEEREFGVYDTAREDNIGHAEVMQTKHGSRNSRPRRRKIVRETFTSVISPADFWGGSVLAAYKALLEGSAPPGAHTAD